MMDLKIFFLMSLILTVSSGKNSRSEQFFEEREEDKQLSEESSGQSEEKIQHDYFKESINRKNIIEVQNFTESSNQSNETFEQEITKDSVDNNDSEIKEQINSEGTFNVQTNVEQKNNGNSGDEQEIENKNQQKPNDKLNDKNIENKDFRNQINTTYEQNKEQTKSTNISFAQNIATEEQIKPVSLSNEQNNKYNDQLNNTDDKNEQNIENQEKQKPINKLNEQSEERKVELTPIDPRNSESISEENQEPLKHKDLKPNYENVGNKNTDESFNGQSSERNDYKNLTSTSDANNKNKDLTKPIVLKLNDRVNEKSNISRFSLQPQEVKLENNSNTEGLKLENYINQDSVTVQLNDETEQQNSKVLLKGQNVEQKNLTDIITGHSNNITEQNNSTESFGKLNEESSNKLKPNVTSNNQKYEDLENQESKFVLNKQKFKDIGEESKNKPFNMNSNTVPEKPNIVVIMADDMGWNDFSYHGSDQILTPNIDVIAYQGVVLQQHYTDAYGTPSRSAFFTGKYPFRLGTQSESILASEDRGLPVSERLLPSYLKELGYSTHLVGKWALGKSREDFLPTNRGFDTFFGFLDSAVDYYTYNHVESWNNTQYFGLDLYDNRIPVEHIKGHLTEVLTEHAVQLIKNHPESFPMYLQVSHAAPHAGGGLVNLQPPVDEIAKNDHIAHTARRLYAGMVTSLDNSVGQIIAALAEKRILNNTVIVFLTDNGAPTVGPTQNYGSNLPLRGIKGTPWEGGVRSSAIMWHHNVETTLWDGLFHITDWLPTLVSAAGGNITEGIDGVNQWQPINNNGLSKRKNALITVDDLNSWAAMIEGDYKIIIGNAFTNEFSGYSGIDLTGFKYEPPYYGNVLLDCETARVMKDMDRELDLQSAFLKRNDTLLIEIGKVNLRELCIPSEAKGCLFNIKEDPLEAHDIWATSPDLIKRLTLLLRTMWAELKPRSKPARDDRCNPAKSNFVWTQWLENEEPHPATLLFPAQFPLQASKDELQYLVDINMNSFKDKISEYVQGMGDSFVKSVSGLFNF